MFRAVLKREPKDLTALNNIGIARDLQGHHADAQTAYRQALAINPGLELRTSQSGAVAGDDGTWPQAVRLLKARASDPAAPVKVRRDYAVVLAMAGNQPEAERVLSEDLPADQVRQVLDNATGVRSAVHSDGSPAVAMAQPPRDKAVPPDVVQVPEGTAPARPPVAGGTVGTRVASSAMPAPAVAALATTPAPMVVRPTPTDAETPMAQPVNSIAAAMTNQRPLALSLHSGEGSPPAEWTSTDTPSGHAPSGRPRRDPPR